MSRQQSRLGPESTFEYQEGCDARRKSKTRDACPYGGCQLEIRSRWLAGWHDTDMTMSRRRLP